MKQEQNKKTALGFFLQKESKKLKNYVYTFFNDGFFSVDADDIIQDVALNIYNKLDFDKPGHTQVCT